MQEKLKLCESLVKELCDAGHEILNRTSLPEETATKSKTQEKITEALEKKTRISQEIYNLGQLHREILDNSSDVILITDELGRLIILAGNTQKLLGCSRSALKKMETIENFFRQPAVKSKVLQTGREIKNQEIQIQYKNGKSRFLLLNARNTNLKSGGMIYAFQDISELKATEAELIQYRDYLEQLVEKRTSILRQENAERQKAEKQLKESEIRYRYLFEHAPISLWEEDFCKAKQYMNQLKSSGVTDLRAYFEQNPKELIKCAQMIKIVEVNQATLKLFKALSREDFFRGLKTFFFKESYQVFKEELLALDEGQTSIECETVNKNLKGEKIYVAIKILCPHDSPLDCHRALVSITDLTKRKHIEEELQKSREKYRALAAHLENAREQERSRIAREIHDELGQTLTALKIDLFWLKQKMPQGEKLLLEKIDYMAKIIDFSVTAVHRISSQLRPEILDQLGLFPAIQWYADKFLKYTDIKVQLQIEPFKAPLKKELATAIFRIFQEATTNVARHAKADKVRISLKPKNNHLELKISDNGKGITSEQINSPNSFGLMGIQERVQTWNGTFKIEGIPKRGSTLLITMPIELEAKNHSPA